MEKTGIFATEDEFKDLIALAEQGWMDGDIVFVTSLMEGIRKDNKTRDARETCHALALAHGLPEIEGFYGIDKNREFVKA